MKLFRFSVTQWFLFLLASLALAVGVSLMTGAMGFGVPKGPNGWVVLTQIRGPRVFLAVLTGAVLAVSGAVMQGLFRNPLADPGLVGVSSGAALGAALVIVCLGNTLSMWSVPIGGMIGGLLTTLLLYCFATRRGITSTGMIILSGVALSAFAGAITGILVFRANDTALRDLTFWTMGSLAGSDWMRVVILLPFFVVSFLLFISINRSLNAILLGDIDAALMGFRVERTKKIAILGVALAIGPLVSFVGVIGFIGVVVPHLVRLITGPDHRLVLPGSALLGAILLLIADTLARVIAIPADVPVGVVTAAIGAPMFAWLLLKTRDLGEVG
ncbi:FecCD family ABC transporter permease [Neokomagataea anthophila]|uniref:Iron ABC transporter permease n=1 Tax=Neokomagataea anthophila TaxID=2826925 RepID=A0ABS5E972_9PROT|nr:iron ABC transporter permease [Neokomagataea anthophila]MBR0560442.1 iron ABC transporter permease [Neokomagataea anthophila]